MSAWGNKVYNISIDNVNEADNGSRESTVKVYTGYGDEYNVGDIHDISISNIASRIAKHPVQVVAEVMNIKLRNVIENNPTDEGVIGI